MPRFAFHASHEQFSPRELLACVQAAEQAGFDGAMSSDHFAPWSARQGHSGFAWSWMGAALQATRAMPIGMITVPQGWRYHPAVVAQAAATLVEMFPGRLPWLAVGSGQALSEHITGDRWPSKAERNARLRAAVDIIRALWRGDTVSCDGPIKVDRARIYSLPDAMPPLIAGALSPETAGLAGEWADGLITINQPLEKVRAIVQAFQQGGGAGKPMKLQVHVSWAGTEDEALEQAWDQWRSNVLPGPVAETLCMPEEFDGVSEYVRREDMHEHVLIGSDAGRMAERLSQYIDLGFDEVILHNVGRNQLEFIQFHAARLKPALQNR